jgi:hypothetical protein
MQLYDRYVFTNLDDVIDVVYSWTWDDYDDFMLQYGPDTHPDKWKLFWRATIFYEGIGSLVKRNVISIDYVAELYGLIVPQLWEKIASVILTMRQLGGRQELLDGFEYL